VDHGPLAASAVATASSAIATASDGVATGRSSLGVLPGQRLYVIGAGMPRERLQQLARRAAASGDFTQVLLVHDCAERVELGCGDCPFGARDDGGAPPAARYRDAAPRSDLAPGGPGAVCLRQYRTSRAEAPGLAPVADALTSGRLATALGTPALDPRRDRVIVCASPPIAAQVREILAVWGFTQTERGIPGHFAIDCADWCRSSLRNHAPPTALGPASRHEEATHAEA
jgi:ferredoxin--NADP+ reductase